MDELDQLRAEVAELRFCVRALGEAILWSVAVGPPRFSDPATDIVRRVEATLKRYPATSAPVRQDKV